MSGTIENQNPMIHVRFEGKSWDLPLSQLGLGSASSPAEIRESVSRVLGLSIELLNDYTVEEHANGNVTIRPEAVFG
ncbi:MAG: hypothetical protein IT186_25820 [Acidobacteria bacterium]|nr:hypothetical protein [Acidobacteriota bacterium]MCK6681613.1 hypothetical protein [Thermoanaerobaculia bacterium]